MTEIKNDIDGLKDKLESLEQNLEGQISTLKNREEKWKKLDEEAANLKKNQNNVVKFNVSGELFATRSETLLNVKDTLFYKIVMSKKFDLNKEIFIDRTSKFFSGILNYFRKGTFNYDKYSNDDLEELKVEADYYELIDISTYLEDRLKEPIIVNFTFSGAYTSGGAVIGSNKVEDVNDRNLDTGICATTPGWIIFELNYEFDLSSVDVGGYRGNSTYWASSNGSNASIMISKDGVSYTSVGTIPSTYANNIVNVPITRCTGKFIKLNHSTYLGVGYFKAYKA